MEKKGFIKISRSIDDWEYADDLAMIGFWVRLLLLANWEDRNKAKRGEIVITAPILAKICGCSESTVWRYLDKLKRTGEIELSTNHRATKIRIVNYEKFQSYQFDKTADKTADKTHLYKRNKEIKKERESKESSDCFAPPTADQVSEYAKSEGLSLNPDDFVDYYQARDWIINNQPVKDWRALARRWSRKEKTFSGNKKEDRLPDWYDSDPHRKQKDSTASDEDIGTAQEKLRRMGKKKL